jgi:hypothetical protein
MRLKSVTNKRNDNAAGAKQVHPAAPAIKVLVGR